MADKTIGQLPEISQVTDSSLFVLEDTGTAYRTSGGTWKQYLRDSIADDVASAVTSASDAQYAAAAAAQDADDAEAAQQAIENLGVAAIQLSAGATPSVTKAVSPGGAVTLTFGIPPGAKGNQGIQGPQGPQGVQGPKGDTGTAVAVETAGMYYFHVDNDSTSPTFGHLFLTYSGEDAPNFSINNNGHLIWTVS